MKNIISLLVLCLFPLIGHAFAYYDPSTGKLIVDRLEKNGMTYEDAVLHVDALTIDKYSKRVVTEKEKCTEHFTNTEFTAIKVGMKIKQLEDILGCGPDLNQSEMSADGVTELWTFESIGIELEMIQVYVNTRTRKVSYGPDGVTFKIRSGVKPK